MSNANVDKNKIIAYSLATLVSGSFLLYLVKSIIAITQVQPNVTIKSENIIDLLVANDHIGAFFNLYILFFGFILIFNRDNIRRSIQAMAVLSILMAATTISNVYTLGLLDYKPTWYIIKLISFIMLMPYLQFWVTPQTNVSLYSNLQTYALYNCKTIAMSFCLAILTLLLLSIVQVILFAVQLKINLFFHPEFLSYFFQAALAFFCFRITTNHVEFIKSPTTSYTVMSILSPFLMATTTFVGIVILLSSISNLITHKSFDSSGLFFFMFFMNIILICGFNANFRDGSGFSPTGIAQILYVICFLTLIPTSSFAVYSIYHMQDVSHFWKLLSITPLIYNACYAIALIQPNPKGVIIIQNTNISISIVLILMLFAKQAIPDL